MTAARLRQFWADLSASFWLRPAVMTVVAVLLAEVLVRSEGAINLPSWIEGWVYAGGAAGARDVLGAIASATIGVAGTTFSITVAALSLASNQMGPRLLRNFTRDAGNQYALGALVATFAYALVALRSVHEAEEEAFVPQLAVSVGLLLAFCCVGVLIWFIHHVALSINVDRVVALVHADLASALAALPRRGEAARPAHEPAVPDMSSAPLVAPEGGYLRVLDDAALADWAEEQDAELRLRVRPGDFVFPASTIGEVTPAGAQEQAQKALRRGMSLGDSRSVEQDLEFAVRQLVEIGLRALSPGINDPFTAIAVLDRLGATLCELAGRTLPDGRTLRDGRLRLERPATDYGGLVDAMFHMLRQAATAQPAVMIRLLEVLAEAAALESDPAHQGALRRHAALARDAALGGTEDAAACEAIAQRHALVLAAPAAGGAEEATRRR
ncbi:DUF2254 domain-containing protein [Roseicella aquatilis]|uniref:DUF2254 domain-containing protein n=1 Tax=Roseicella aquatilis TaxID=2527868 RepID=A0A4R4DBW3_9PROT|nr:DUF2254 domain-containing protein [Roseicella aquatilis]TCZ57310.1 DUF2254 domain-containing protein [Roseicella aquatilis]